MCRIRVLDSVLKHGISREVAVLVFSQAITQLRLRGGLPKWLVADFDLTGRLLELIYVVNDDGGIVIIHMMKASKAAVDTVRRLER